MLGLSFEGWVAVVALGLVLLVAAAVAVWFMAGLFAARSLIRRELMAYFTSPIAYVVLVVFLFVTGYRFSVALEQLTAKGPQGAEYPMQVMYSMLPSLTDKLTFAQFLSSMSFALVYLLIPPLLTMRLLAEERSTGTLELLMTAPVRDWQVVLSKYVACFMFYVLLWVPTLVYLPVLLGMGPPVFHAAWTLFSVAFLGGLGMVAASLIMAILPGGSGLRLTALVLLLVGSVAAAVGGWGHYHVDSAPRVLDIPVSLDPMPVVTTYLGLLLAGAMFLALGLLVSSLVRSQLVAALVSLVLTLIFFGIWQVEEPAPENPFHALVASANQVLASLSVPLHVHDDFNRGLLDTRQVTLYVSVALFSLFLTVRSLESRRWR